MIGGEHHLAAGVDQRIECVRELRVGLLALQELQVVDDEHVDAAQRVLQCKRILRPQRGDEDINESLGGEIEHLAVARRVAGPGDRLQQVRLAETDAGMNVQRIEHDRIAPKRDRDLPGRGVSEGVGTPYNK